MNKIEQRISSREVAKMMELRHCDLLEKIDAINSDFGVTENSVDPSKYWIESKYQNEQNKQWYREFQVSKRGCEFLAHKTTGTKGNLFTDRYMDKFEEMKETIENHYQKQMSVMEQIALIAQGTTELDARVEKLENTMTIDYGQQKELEHLVNVKVLDILGGKGSQAYKAIGKKVFSKCNNDVKTHFNVNSRCNIPRVQHENAKTFIQNWTPSEELKMTIIGYNQQIAFV